MPICIAPASRSGRLLTWFACRVQPLTLQSDPRFFLFTYSRFSFRLRIRSLTTWKIAICTAKYTNAVPKTVWTICQ